MALSRNTTLMVVGVLVGAAAFGAVAVAATAPGALGMQGGLGMPWAMDGGMMGAGSMGARDCPYMDGQAMDPAACAAAMGAEGACPMA